MNKSEALIRNINFTEFKDQRDCLNGVIAYAEKNMPILYPHLLGIQTLCDNIVDHAIDDLGIDAPLVSEDEFTIDIRGEGKKADLVKELKEILATLESEHPEGESEHPNLFSSIINVDG